jgi:aminoglycoside phosphotransferase family enzyme/predicted kinase
MNVPDSSGPLTLQARLVASLRDAVARETANPGVALIETHISYVLLTGNHAYKIKKAVGLDFLDFRTLSARRYFCQEEFRLNRRFAPELYLEVVPITGTADAPVIGGHSPAIEYAVKMREFSQTSLASEVLARGDLTAGDIDALAAAIASAHQSASKASASDAFGAPERILDAALGNFRQIRPLLDRAEELAAVAELERLERWTVQEHGRRSPAMARRRSEGRVRECHGDLHLGNIAFVGRLPTMFDCIEFNEEMRWIDVMSELAFAVMDLRDRGRPDFAHRLQNAYLETSGDYDGLHVLRFYLVYRAMVRAKIARLRATQVSNVAAKSAALAEFHGYLRLALHYVEPRQASLVITHGLSGSGKSTLAQALLEHTGAVRIRTDVERKRRPDRPDQAPAGQAIGAGLYTTEATRETYARVLALACMACENGYPVIADATFLKRWQRQAFRAMAREIGVPFVVASCAASASTLRERITRRLAGGGDASQADLAVLEHQLRTQEPLDTDEQYDVVAFDSDAVRGANEAKAPWRGIIDRIAARIGAAARA